MVSVTVRLSRPLAADIEAEAKARRMSKSDVVRDRLERAPKHANSDPLASIRDLIGSVDSGLTDVSSRKKHYLQAWGYGRKRPPR